MKEDGNKLKITYQWCNGFATCKISSGELLYIPFLNSGLYTSVIYPKELDIEIFYFQWTTITQMQSLYQKILKQCNGDQK